MGPLHFNEFGATTSPVIFGSRLVESYSEYEFVIASTSFDIIKKDGEQSSCGTTTGITCLGVRGDNDVDNRAPSSGDFGDLLWASSEVSDPAKRPKLIITYTLPLPASQDITYTYDNIGDITKIVDASDNNSAKTVNYLYDDLYRLERASSTNATTTDFLRTYSYNVIGNITSKSDQGTYLYEGHLYTRYANPHAATDINGIEQYYDKNGNLVGTEEENSWTWDYNNRLIEVETAAEGVIASYAYDHEGMRVKKTTDSGTTIYPNKYYNKKDSEITKHIFLPDGTLIATVAGGGYSTSTHIIHTDHLGGTHVVSDEYGNQVELNDYYPFGELRIDEGAIDEQRKFTGHMYDSDTDLIYMGARYYPGNRARFLSQDPAFLDIGTKSFRDIYSRPLSFHLSSPQNLNSYSYTINNPIKLVDPEGETPWLFPAIRFVVSFFGRVFTGIGAYEFKTVVIDHPEVFSEQEINKAGGEVITDTVLWGTGRLMHLDGVGSLTLDAFGSWLEGIDILDQKLKDRKKEQQKASQINVSHGTSYSSTNQCIPGTNYTPLPQQSSNSYMSQTYTVPSGAVVDWYGNIISDPPGQ